jgi:DNA topoisomerase-1
MKNDTTQANGQANGRANGPADGSVNGDEGTIVDAPAAAEQAGLVYVSDEEPGIRRRRSGKGFSFRNPDGSAVKDKETLARIKSLAIPPAYTDVWICADPKGHIQATGRDDRGRKQYRYHPRWREVRDSTKYERMLDFGKALPAIRERISADMGKRDLPREKVLATVVHLLENTLIRVGNATYSKENKSFGLTTLQDRHVEVDGGKMRFQFKGKSGKTWNLQVKDRRIARIVKSCQDVPGQHLFQYLDDEGQRHGVTSQDVNDYLREISGQDFSAKDFRTWAGTVLAAIALTEFESFDTKAAAKRNLRDAIERVSSRLGNTPAICRKCYIHPQVLDCYLEGDLVNQLKDQIEEGLRTELDALKPEEAAVMSFLHRRLTRDAAA